MIIDNIIFENKIETDMISLIKSLNKEELDDILKNIDLSNKAIVILENN